MAATAAGIEGRFDEFASQLMQAKYAEQNFSEHIRAADGTNSWNDVVTKVLGHFQKTVAEARKQFRERGDGRLLPPADIHEVVILMDTLHRFESQEMIAEFVPKGEISQLSSGIEELCTRYCFGEADALDRLLATGSITDEYVTDAASSLRVIGVLRHQHALMASTQQAHDKIKDTLRTALDDVLENAKCDLQLHRKPQTEVQHEATFRSLETLKCAHESLSVAEFYSSKPSHWLRIQASTRKLLRVYW